MSGALVRRTGTAASRFARAVVAVLPQWVAARLIVLGALALAHLIVSRTHPSAAGVASRVHAGLLGWDAGWYESIARFGYAPLGHGSLRFFPLVPIAARILGAVPGVGDGPALIVIANLSALVATALLYVLARRETGDERLARRAVWFLSLAPPAFTLVMGYAEATLLVFALAFFLALRPADGRRPAWWWAAGWGLAAALTRPLGAVLLLAAAVEAWRWWPRCSPAAKVAAVGSVLGPLAGVGAFLVWSWAVFDDALLPLRVQTEAGHHGGLSDPVLTLVHDAQGALHRHFGTALHVPWVLAVLALLVVCWRRWPATYGAFATGVVVVALTGTNLDSFERYALSAFPLVLAGASIAGRPLVERSVIALMAAGLAAYSLLAFLNLSVP